MNNTKQLIPEAFSYIFTLKKRKYCIKRVFKTRCFVITLKFSHIHMCVGMYVVVTENVTRSLSLHVSFIPDKDFKILLPLCCGFLFVKFYFMSRVMIISGLKALFVFCAYFYVLFFISLFCFLFHKIKRTYFSLRYLTRIRKQRSLQKETNVSLSSNWQDKYTNKTPKDNIDLQKYMII